jgi:hypothetical protein
MPEIYFLPIFGHFWPDVATFGGFTDSRDLCMRLGLDLVLLDMLFEHQMDLKEARLRFNSNPRFMDILTLGSNRASIPLLLDPKPRLAQEMSSFVPELMPNGKWANSTI